ncbi:MAG: glycosyltransferase family 2 protein [Planctomycetota bacterium]
MAEHRTLVALPVFNEEATVEDVVRQVLEIGIDVLVVDDGSTDGTRHVLAGTEDISVVRHAKNRGYGAALATAFHYARSAAYEAVVTIDCDGQHTPGLIPDMVAALRLGSIRPFDHVSGSRYYRDDVDASSAPADRRAINKKVTCLLNEHLGLDLTDAFCGFKAYRVAALKDLNITETGYAMPLQFWPQVVDADWRVTEFPVPLIYLDENRSFGGSLDDAAIRMAHYLDVLNAELASRGLPSLAPEDVPCGG